MGVPRTERVITPDGQFETDTEFQVVDADSLRSAEGELQPRDRMGRVESGSQIQHYAANLDPLRLTNSRESDRGAPVVDENGTILSGNGRVVVSSAMGTMLAAVPGGPGRSGVHAFAQPFDSSNSAADAAATALYGPRRGGRKRGPPRF